MPEETYVNRIGETAGAVWHALNAEGPMSMTAVVKAVNRPRDLVMQAIGWLAREGKLRVVEEGRSRTVSLTE
ncbi:MAG: hypothetical protein D6741_11420 [Planctomycetota bacterium]|nr:MAG: hypothetical protein D6741_11420 [Planctomycetota bacterium]